MIRKSLKKLSLKKIPSNSYISLQICLFGTRLWLGFLSKKIIQLLFIPTNVLSLSESKTIAGLSTSSPGLETAKPGIVKFQLQFDKKGFRLILSLNLFSFLSRPITTGNVEEKKSQKS
jgi:hypothetical protein